MAKVIGILGGMTPESTTLYYDHIIHTYMEENGDYGFPEIIIYSVEFQSYEDWMIAGEWDRIGRGLGKCAQSLEKAGADFIVIATNTMHNVLESIQAAVSIPILSIIDATAEEIRKDGMDTVGLLGTIFTMKEAFYKDRLATLGIRAVVPDEDGLQTVNRIIFEELGKGIIREESRQAYVEIIQELRTRGAQGVILGCTEIPLLVQDKDCSIPLFNTSTIHAEKALAYAME
jgi:aspartate racemase